ncbi:hypothetical protein EVAR_3692_1 [Eumeta japonica]|uniref:Uncharacterized protein n=1 Tax=Eumeta variegata TaxID=151549 RepID=A0A4C1STV0_EUMVA|nr:hypothetical protein EVAR_3692_1 [Eumeta japonica]
MARALMLIAMLDADENRSRCLETSRLRRQLRFEAAAFQLSEPEFQAHYRLTFVLALHVSEPRAVSGLNPRRGAESRTELRPAPKLRTRPGSKPKTVSKSELKARTRLGSTSWSHAV